MLPNTQRFFNELGALGYTGPIDDRLHAFLAAELGVTGTVSDLLYNFLGTLGYTGTLTDRVAAFILSGDDLQQAIVCAYPLDATEAQIQSGGFSGKLDVSGDDEQTATLTIPAGSYTEITNAASFAGFTNPTTRVDMSTDDIAWEWEFICPSSDAVASKIINADMANYSDASVNAQVSVNSSGANVLLRHYNNNTLTMLNQSVTPVDGVVRVGLRLSGNTCRAWVGGVEATLSNNTNVLRRANFFAVVNVNRPAGSQDTGKVYGARLVSAGDQYTTTFPGGSVDLCGNPV